MKNIKGLGSVKETNVIEALKKSTSQYSVEVLKLASSQVTLSTAQATAIFTAKGLKGAELEQAVATATLSASQKGTTSSTVGLSAAFKGLYATLAPFAPAIAVIAGAGAAMCAAWYFSIDQTIERNQELRDSLNETTNALKDEAKEADNNANTLSDLCDKYEEAVKGSDEYYSITVLQIKLPSYLLN